MLEKRWDEYILLLKETMLMNDVEFFLKVVVFIVLRNY